jgi:hypothetical protein
VGAFGRVFGVGRLAVPEGTSGTSQLGLCRRLLCSLAWIRRRHRQCAALGWDHFLFPIRVRARILRLPNDPGGRGRRSVTNASFGSLFDSSGTGGLVRCFFVGDESICHLHWTIHCSFETNPGGLPGSFLLHVFGVDDFLVLNKEERKSIVM